MDYQRQSHKGWGEDKGQWEEGLKRKEEYKIGGRKKGGEEWWRGKGKGREGRRKGNFAVLLFSLSRRLCQQYSIAYFIVFKFGANSKL